MTSVYLLKSSVGMTRSKKSLDAGLKAGSTRTLVHPSTSSEQTLKVGPFKSLPSLLVEDDQNLLQALADFLEMVRGPRLGEG